MRPKSPRGPIAPPPGPLALCAALVGLVVCCSVRAESPSSTEDASTRGIYRKSCQPCHGAAGDGNGPVARYFDPRPRNFRLGLYKFRSTESGEPPTDEDLYRVITHGIPGTRMPGWPQLSDEERWGLVRYVRALSEVELPESPRTIVVADEVPFSAESVARGELIFEELQCAKCHGQSGRGDGDSAGTLEDAEGYSITPRNLTRARTYKGGSRPEDVYLRVMGGLGGTPMPSFAESFPLEDHVYDIQYALEEGEAVSAEDRAVYEAALSEVRRKIWDLANYVHSLAREESFVHEFLLGDTELMP